MQSTALDSSRSQLCSDRAPCVMGQQNSDYKMWSVMLARTTKNKLSTKNYLGLLLKTYFLFQLNCAKAKLWEDLLEKICEGPAVCFIRVDQLPAVGIADKTGIPVPKGQFDRRSSSSASSRFHSQTRRPHHCSCRSSLGK